MVDPHKLYACRNCHYLNIRTGPCECCKKNIDEQVQYIGIIGICDPSPNSYNYASLKNLIEDVDDKLELIPGIYAINIVDDEQDLE